MEAELKVNCMEIERQVSVLLVDDRPENLLAMEVILVDLGQKLVSANSGREALRFLLREEAAVVLLDVQMPDMDGFEMAEIIRSRERSQHTPIIFVTAVNKSEQSVFQGYSLGAVDYITKPFKPEILKSKVKFFVELYKQRLEIQRQAEMLAQVNRELDGLNAGLEARVQERTVELQTANRKLEAEVAERRQAEARLTTEHGVTSILAQAQSFKEAAPAILKVFCEYLGADICALWMPDERGEALHCADIECTVPSAQTEKWVEASRSITFAPGTGLPGRIWASREPVWIEDVTADPGFARAGMAAEIGLRSGAGFPILSGEKCLGVIEFFGAITFLTSRPLTYDQSLVSMMTAIGNEISQYIQRKRAEEEIKKSLKEKEVLLKEIHHRVKNNLQIISSLLNLQSRHLQDERVREEFKESQNRIRSMALIHEKLYESTNLSGIDLGKYIKSLTGNLFRSYGANPGIKLKIEVDKVFFNIDKAIPCGLILNELVSNSLKHAFPQEKSGEIRIALRSDNNGKGDSQENSSGAGCLYTLVVGDSGVGVPEGVDFRNTTSLGFQLVCGLTKQLKGTVELDRNNGTEFRINFSL